MVIDREAASRAMHLTHVPNNEERAESFSHCHICLQKSPLTKEHIPPKKAFNNCNRLWDRLIFSDSTQSTKFTHIRGGLWVKTLCRTCNSEVCSPYAQEYVKLSHRLVESPRLFDQSGDARVISIQLNTLLIAKEIATMILAIEQLAFAKHHSELRDFVLDKEATIDPPFHIYAFLVPEVEEAGTVSRFHARVDTYAPGYGFAGGEISWFPFGFVYASKIGKGYQTERLTDITHWFRQDPSTENNNITLRLFCRVTGVDSIQCIVGNKRIRPQIDHISERYV